jgi:uncharacterized protein YjbJ (UPF0337 family)
LSESLENRRTNAVSSAGVTWDSVSNDLEDQIMNKDILEGKWKQMRGEAKAWWGKLTDDDLDRAAGKFEVLAAYFRKNMAIPVKPQPMRSTSA